MEFIKLLEQIISNAKKSLGKPYALETVNEKIIEIENIQKELEKHLTESVLEEGEEEKVLEKFQKLKGEALEILEQHTKKKSILGKRQGIIMESLEINELSAISKLIPIFTGKRNELANFITNLELVHETMSTAKRNAFFNFVFKSRLDTKVQTMVKQDTIPTDIAQLILALKKAYKPVGTSNNLLSKLTTLSQKGETVRSFAEKIQEIVAELNDIQISEVGEADRSSIVRTNNVLAFNTFKNGLRDQQILSTINASRVSNLMEALTIAEESETNIKQKQVLYSTNQSTNGQQGHKKCSYCGRNHAYGKCPAFKAKCRACGKIGHFEGVCRSRNSAGNNNGNNDNRYNNNGNRTQGSHNNINNNNNRGNNRRRRNNNNNGNRNINLIQDQGNSQNPETARTESPVGYN